MPTATARITALDTYDVSFPTSRSLDGLDAMDPDPDYRAAHLILRTDAGDGLDGHGFTFTIGRGNNVQVATIREGRYQAPSAPGSCAAMRRESNADNTYPNGAFGSADILATSPSGADA